MWNAWRTSEPSAVPDLSEAHFYAASLINANLSGANLWAATLTRSDLRGANLVKAYLELARINEANLDGADLEETNLRGAELAGANIRAHLFKANLDIANLEGANLSGAYLAKADLHGARLNDADLSGASLLEANLETANLRSANLRGADLAGTNLRRANLSDADLSGANLSRAGLIETNLENAILTGCRVYGISTWDLKLNEGTKQENLIITPKFVPFSQEEGLQPEVLVDNAQVAQFIYLLLNNAQIRYVIDTIGRKGVLLLGRFTEGRIAVLERLRHELRERGYLPIVFNFDKPQTKDFTETIRLLAGLSHFVIADVTNPKSAPLELQATVPDIMVPFRPIIEHGQEPFAMLQDLWIKHRDWVFEPLYYSSLDALVGALDEKIIRPAEIRFAELLARKAEKMKGEHV